MTAAFWITLGIALAGITALYFWAREEIRHQKLRAHRHAMARDEAQERARYRLKAVTQVAFQAIGTDDPESWKQALGNVLLVTKEGLASLGMTEAEWEATLAATPAPPRVRRRFPQAPTTAAIQAGFETPTASVHGMAAQAQEEWAEEVAETAVEAALEAEGLDPEGEA